MEQKKWSLQLGERNLEVETGLLAGQANGAVTVRYGDTVVLATAVMSKGASRISGYFPLMVDFEERYYAAGKIKGSRFIKREGRPSDASILSGRMVDRTIRPLFPSRMRNDVQVVLTVLSYDGENDPALVAVIAASTALSISDIPWNGPVAAVRVGKTTGPALNASPAQQSDSKLGDKHSDAGGDLILNPVNGEISDGSLDLVIAGTKNKINMLEAGAKEIPEAEILKALQFGSEYVKKVAEFVESIQKEIGKPKSEPALLKGTDEFEAKVKEILLAEGLATALYDQDKKVVEEKTEATKEKVNQYIKETFTEDVDRLLEISGEVFEEVSDEIVHQNVLEKEQRPDGRKLNEIRKITCQTGILPRTHGTGLFTRGETQALTVTTLGSPGDEQIIDTMEVDMKKRYIHHYNFPPFSVGETKPMRGPGRREIGHGALAEKALIPVLPSKEDFPYTILLVSEILSSNGSSSMASTCGSTLSLMDAGVPIKRPVSGIAMGIIVGATDDKFKVLTDIQGLEDHYGDMDFKVAGTENGITALQMDVKLAGVTLPMLEAVLKQSYENRLEILEKIKTAIAEPRTEMSQYAPRIITMHINPEKIRNVIGAGGKIINEIIDETGVQIDIEDDGSVFITSVDAASAKKAQEWIHSLTREVKAGETFEAKVIKLMDFGAFAEILPGQDGLIHISEMADKRVEKVEDVVKVGDIVPVKVKEIDSQGRISLSMKAAIKK
ncbi:MAG: polyribonucleotide nucleotidyltransferase [Candidatus Moranbacteria bacterium CG10_big_fil_rev_8_21_14_0_10_35_21]|nr:MAG: polyribonucleotide nucleotidyltransferase [Candidatus Moranbacteria bacterium CG10_big_fil_rev_8_21_14_0_10_35_21]PJA88652.1 MAG: polyribonucleotide nucleotidyltransferase [Candidatus Moranbacteria bacterium CG_4_9_14_3_um_filter_36_9]